MQAKRWMAGLLLAHLGGDAPVHGSDWFLARSPGFVVVSERGEAQARKVATQFEQFRGLFRQLFDARVDPGRPVVVFDLADVHSMEALAGPPRGRDFQPSGFFVVDPSAEKHFIVARADDIGPDRHGRPGAPIQDAHIVYHEYVHLLNRLNFRRLPTWVNEGLAEFYATAEIDDDSIRFGRVRPDHLLVLKNARLSLADLFAATPASPLYNERRRVGPLYSYAALLTHYLSFEPSRRGQLTRYLTLLRKDTPPSEAAREAFGDFRALEDELKGYARRQTFTAVTAPARVEATAVQTLSLKPHEVDTLRGDFMARRGRRTEARRRLQAALEAAPGQAIAHEAMGILEEEEGRTDAAFRHYTEAARLAPASIVGPFRLGLLAMAGDPNDRARREAALRQALRINPGFAPAHAALARVLLEAENPAVEAVNLAARASALDPGVDSYRFLLWHAFERTGDAAKAKALETELRGAALADADALATLALRLEEIGRVDAAEALLREAQATNPAAPELLSWFLAQQRRWEEVLAIDRAALAREQDSPRRQNGVAYALVQLGRDLPEALRLVERALKKDPRSAASLDTKGLVLHRMGKLLEAETALRAALAADGDDPEVVAHLADVLAARGKRAEAIAELERGLEMPSPARVRAEIRARLAALRKPGSN